MILVRRCIEIIPVRRYIEITSVRRYFDMNNSTTMKGNRTTRIPELHREPWNGGVTKKHRTMGILRRSSDTCPAGGGAFELGVSTDSSLLCPPRFASLI